jgi:Tfp pilus assembly protein PilF
MRRLFVVVLLMGTLAGPAMAKKKGGGGDASEHRNKGVDLATAKQFDAAIVEFNKAIEIEPGNPSSYHDRGTAYRAMAKLAEAITDFTKEIELAPKDPAGYLDRSQTFLNQNQYDAALADANKVVERGVRLQVPRFCRDRVKPMGQSGRGFHAGDLEKAGRPAKLRQARAG